MTIVAQISSVILLVLLTLSTYISTLDKQKSYEVLLFWCCGILIFFISSFIRLKFTVVTKIVSLLTLFCISLYALYLMQPHLFLFLGGHNSYQFIIPTEGGHNHLGDLVGLCLTLTFISRTSLLSQFDIILFYVIMLGSFSKSSFFALSLSYAAIFLKKRTSYLYGMVIICIALFALLLYTKEFEIVPSIKQIQRQFTSITHLPTKPLLSSREFYTQQAISGWQSSDFVTQIFGFGLGNFKYPSQKTATKLDYGAPDAHNILLSLFIESGPLATVWFLIFSLLILIVGFTNQNLFIYPFLYLFIHFQTDYTFLISFFFFSFFISAGQSVISRHEKHHKVISGILFAVALTLTVSIGCLYLQFTSQKTKLLNTLDTQIKKQDKPALFKSLQSLEQLQPYDTTSLIRLSSIYEAFGDDKNAVRLIEKLSVFAPRDYLLSLSHQLDLQSRMGIDIRTYLQSRKNDFMHFPFTKEEKKELNGICMDFIKKNCY